MEPCPPIFGVVEIVLSVGDLPAMREFYTTVLGFPVHSEVCMEEPGIADPVGEPTICFLTVAPLGSPLGSLHPQMLVLIDHLRHAYARSRFTGHDVGKSTLNHVAFEVPLASFDDHRARLHALGLSTTEMTFQDLNAKALFFHDPEGNELEFICSCG